MLALFARYDDATRELLASLATAGVAVTPVVLQYDGELPDGALSPFVNYTGLELTGRPLFFNEVPVPPWSEIRQGREPHAEIRRGGDVIGRIVYEGSSFRQVASVEWLLPDGAVARIEHYDRYGNRYATTHHAGGVPYQTLYAGPGEWRIEVDHVSRIVTMRSSGGLLTFATLADFVSHFLDSHGLAGDAVLINSLSHPLFVMRKRAAAPNTTLFWQEPMPGDVPGNMVAELERPRALARLVFDDERLLRKVAAAYPTTPVELVYLSQLGQFAPKPAYEPRRAFTLTNTDELPWLVEILESLPDVTISVAALTLMSEKLHALGRRYPNLTLIPGITQKGIADELARASVYLDLNAGQEVLDVVKAAYHLDLVVLAPAPHAKAPDHSLTFPTPAALVATLSAVVTSPGERRRALEALHTKRGPLSTPDDYRRLFS